MFKIYVTLSKFVNFSKIYGIVTTYFIGSLLGLNTIIYEKYLVQRSANSKCIINITYYYYFIHPILKNPFGSH